MLRLKALHLEDFGPFKGRQAIHLSSNDGVTIVYGENMRGKTSLLNAVRFAFFGKVLSRGTHSLPLHKLGNWEQAAAGKFGFKVELEFNADGQDYRLTRSCRARTAVASPETDEDYQVDVFVERSGQILGPQQGEAELRRLLPEQISRFFLFDAELLQEYEDLLSAESDMGRRISEAIERILGVPVLTSARATLLSVKEKSERRVATAAQGDQKTQEFGNQLADLHSKREVLGRDLERHSEELTAIRARKAGLEEAMKKRERVAALLDKRDSLERAVNEASARENAKHAELQAGMANAWAVLLATPMRDATKVLRAREVALAGSQMREDVLYGLEANDHGECPTCLQTVPAAARARIAARVQENTPAARADANRELFAVRRRLEALETYDRAGAVDVLRILWTAMEEAKVDAAAKRDELAEIARQVEGIDEEVLRKTKADFEQVIRQIDALERGISDELEAINKNQSSIDAIQKRLDRLAGANLAEEQRRRNLYTELHRLFDRAVTVYREQLRRRVEIDATAHFRALTTEPEYAALRINESYGLTIVHEDGSEIAIRSAGAEHVVALSLMGALQNNAPLRGPIVIDSPFGRLDRQHTKNIVRALPTMASQVLLLVYEDELPASLARTELKSHLKGEWRLERHSAKHTRIVPRVDDHHV